MENINFSQKIEFEKNAELFSKYIDDAISHNEHAEFFHKYTVDEYKKMKLVVFGNGIAMLAIKENGELVSYIKNEELARKNNIKNVSEKMLPFAIKNGVDRLDCYDGFLPKLYGKYNFIPITDIGFDESFAPSNWKYQEFGKPSILFMSQKYCDFVPGIRDGKNYENGYDFVDNYQVICKGLGDAHKKILEITNSSLEIKNIYNILLDKKVLGNIELRPETGIKRFFPYLDIKSRREVQRIVDNNILEINEFEKAIMDYNNLIYFNNLKNIFVKDNFV